MDNYTENTILAYVNDYSGWRGKYVIKKNAENVAKFIMLKGSNADIIFTDWMDCFVGKTFGIFVDRFADQAYMQCILQKLVPMQQSSRIPNAEDVEMVDYYSLS